MSDIHQPPHRQLTHREAWRAIRRCARTVDWGRSNPRRGLEIIEPFHSCNHVPDVSASYSDATLAFICAATADCYVALDDPETAAAWYQRACHDFKGGGWPYFYAHLVIKHSLSEHYECALQAVSVAQRKWRGRHWLARFTFHVISLWWLRPGMWRIVPRQRSFADELARRLRSTSAG